MWLKLKILTSTGTFNRQWTVINLISSSWSDNTILMIKYTCLKHHLCVFIWALRLWWRIAIDRFDHLRKFKLNPTPTLFLRLEHANSLFSVAYWFGSSELNIFLGTDLGMTLWLNKLTLRCILTIKFYPINFICSHNITITTELMTRPIEFIPETTPKIYYAHGDEIHLQ